MNEQTDEGMRVIQFTELYRANGIYLVVYSVQKGLTKEFLKS